MGYQWNRRAIDYDAAEPMPAKTPLLLGPALALLVGAALFGVVQALLFWSTAPIPDVKNSGWFLNSGAGVGAVSLTFAVVGALVGFARRNGAAEASMIAIGAALAMIAVLFSIGPGSIFPIVIAVGLVILASATTTGAVLGTLIRRASTTKSN